MLDYLIEYTWEKFYNYYDIYYIWNEKYIKN